VEVRKLFENKQLALGNQHSAKLGLKTTGKNGFDRSVHRSVEWHFAVCLQQNRLWGVGYKPGAYLDRAENWCSQARALRSKSAQPCANLGSRSPGSPTSRVIAVIGMQNLTTCQMV